jgi:hypothetical protein
MARRGQGVMQRRNILAILAAASTAACASMNPWREPDKVDPNLFPADYKADVIRLVRKSVDNPKDVRDAFVSDPALKPFASDSRYVVCVRFNDGHQVAPQEKMAVYFGGNPTQFIDATPDKCPASSYKPFPEVLMR